MKTKYSFFSRAANRSFGVIFALAIVLRFGALDASAQGPVSPLYLTAGNQNTIFVVQGANVVTSWSMVNNNEYGIAVTGGTVYTTIGASGFPGSEYSLSGSVLGSSTFPNVPGSSIYDATSDGTYIYGWDWIQSRVLRFGPNWSNPTALFSTGASPTDFLGITYDPFNNSLWISGWNQSQIQDYSLSGQLLSSFSVSHDEIAALAMDPATGTLWAANRNTQGLFEEYSTTGQLLSSQYYPALSGMDILGGEFEVPEPGATGLLAMGLFLIRWKRSLPIPMPVLARHSFGATAAHSPALSVFFPVHPWLNLSPFPFAPLH